MNTVTATKPQIIVRIATDGFWDGCDGLDGIDIDQTELRFIERLSAKLTKTYPEYEFAEVDWNVGSSKTVVTGVPIDDNSEEADWFYVTLGSIVDDLLSDDDTYVELA